MLFASNKTNLKRPILAIPHAAIGKPAAVFAAIALLAVLSRAPFLSAAGIDEAFYLVVGRQWLNGLPPYAHSFDVKPPLLFFSMALSEAVFGPTLMAAKALVIAAVTLTAFGLYLFGLRFFGALSGIAAALLYIGSTLSLGGAFAVAELLMAPFTTFGMLFGVGALAHLQTKPAQPARSDGRARAVPASGLLFGAAICIKQTAIFEAAPLALALVIAGTTGQPRRAALFAAGFCIVPSACAAYFLAIGHGEDFISAVGLAAIMRAGIGYLPWSEALRLMLTGTLPVLPILLMAGIFWAERRTLREQGSYPSILFLAAWPGAALLGALVTKAMFVIYLLPLLQPLCLAAGGFLEHVLGRIARPRRRAAIRASVLAAATLYSGLFTAPLYFAGDKSVKAAEAAAALMAKEGARPGERILVVDRDLLVYVDAEAEPPVPIFHPQQLLCNFPAQGAATALSGAIRSRPAFVVVADPPYVRVCEDKNRRDALKAALAEDYCALGRFDSAVTGWPGSFIVFGLKARLTAPSSNCGPDMLPAGERRLDK
jgi:4-amino-4-deoxy-L-arabinose transferase-like glycosyltransferase